MASKGRARSPTQLCPQRSGGLRERCFLVSRGMGVSPGEESAGNAVADKACRGAAVDRLAQPSLRPCGGIACAMTKSGKAQRVGAGLIVGRITPSFPGLRCARFRFDKRLGKSQPRNCVSVRIGPGHCRPPELVHQPAGNRSARSVNRRHAEDPTRKAATKANASHAAPCAAR